MLGGVGLGSAVLRSPFRRCEPCPALATELLCRRILVLAPGTLHAAPSRQVGAGNGRTGGESLVGWLGSVKDCSNRLRAYQRGAVVRSHAREIWCSEVGEPDCHQIVTIGGGFRPLGPSLADLLEEKMPGKFGTYPASSAPSAGLKILVSAGTSSVMHLRENMKAVTLEIRPNISPG